jgi:hypothetical protein
MQFSDLPIKNLLLTTIGFFFGLASAFLGQLISRRFLFNDRKARVRYGYLLKIRSWMEAYEQILDCQYPDLMNFWMSPVIAPSLGVDIREAIFDADEAELILYHLKKYKCLKESADNAARIGIRAINTFKEHRTTPFLLLLKFSANNYQRYGRGFPQEVIGHIEKFHTIYDNLFCNFEKTARARIDWDAVDIVKPENLATIVKFAELRSLRQHLGESSEDYGQLYSKLRESLNSVYWEKHKAKEELEEIFRIIRKYEIKWEVSANM